MSDKTKTKAPTIITVSKDTITVSSVADSAKRNAQGKRSMDRNAGNCWAYTVLWLHAQKSLSEYSEETPEDIAEALRTTFKTSFLDEYGELPETGKNARTGKTIDVLNGKGEVKWSSWEETKLPMSYMGDIAKVIHAGLVDDLIVGENKVLGKTDILNKSRAPETPMGACERGIKLVEDNFGGLSEAEILVLQDKLMLLADKLTQPETEDKTEAETEEAVA